MDEGRYPENTWMEALGFRVSPQRVGTEHHHSPRVAHFRLGHKLADERNNLVPRVIDAQPVKRIRKLLRVLELLKNPLHFVFLPIPRHWV